MVDNTSARNQNLKLQSESTKAKLPDNTGNAHKPHDLNAPVNGKPNDYSSNAGATAVGVVPAEQPVASEEVVKAADETKMFHQDGDDWQQCSDFCNALDEALDTGIDVDGSLQSYVKAVDPAREIKPAK